MLRFAVNFHNTMKAYGVADVQIHSFIILALGGEREAGFKTLPFYHRQHLKYEATIWKPVSVYQQYIYSLI
jgi:molybdopterin synthase catalytic subunit